MKSIILTLLLSSCSILLLAQSKLAIQAGWTASNMRVLASAEEWPQPTSSNFLHRPYLGISYQYNYKKFQLSTGLSSLILGASGGSFLGNGDWEHWYVVVPILGGYSITLSKEVQLVVQGGAEIGYKWANSTLVIGRINDHKGLVNLTAGAALAWKQFQWGTRGHWGLTDFEKMGATGFRHTGLSTYLSYTFWNSKRAKAKRLEKQQ